MATEAANRIYAVVLVADGASLTVIGEGAIDVTANETTPRVAYLFWKRGTTGYLVIESGEYHMNHSEDSMVYTNGNEIVTIKGGSFTLDNLDDENSPWIFNTQGQGDIHVIVTGGTFNADINRQKWSSEVIVPVTHYTVKNDNGTWTVHEGAVAYVNTGMTTGPYFAPKDIGYATIEEALRAAMDYSDSPVTLLKDVTLNESMTIDKDITVNKGDYAFDVAEGVTLTISAGTYDWDVNEYCVETRFAKNNGDGTWTVTAKFLGYNISIEEYLGIGLYYDMALFNGTEYYAELYHTKDADGNPIITKIPFDAWVIEDGMRKIKYENLGAQEMTDIVNIRILTTDGTVVSDWNSTASIRAIAMLQIQQIEAAANADDNPAAVIAQYQELLTVYAELLNYGAEIQNYTNYKTNDLANNQLTAAQQAAYAIAPDAFAEDGITKNYAVIADRNALNWAGQNIALGANLKLNLYFNVPAGTVIENLTITVTYDGKPYELEADKVSMSSGFLMISLDKLPLTNAVAPINITINDGETTIGRLTYSISDAAYDGMAYHTNLASVYEAILKVSSAVYNFDN